MDGEGSVGFTKLEVTSRAKGPKKGITWKWKQTETKVGGRPAQRCRSRGNTQYEGATIIGRVEKRLSRGAIWERKPPGRDKGWT